MPTQRRPKGSYTRHTTDWLISQCMIGGAFYFPAHGNGGAVELYNNAADGSCLHIYRLWYSNDASGPYWITRQPGTMGGTVVTSYPVVSQGSPGPGVVSYGDVGGTSFPPSLPFAMGAFIASDNEAGSQDTYGADGPICVLSPGDSLRAINPWASGISSGIIGVTFYWAAIRDTG